MTEEPTGVPVEGAAGAPRPENIPEKFWDPVSSSVRVDALAASYRTLEQKLSANVSAPATQPGGPPPVAAPSEPADPAPEYRIDTKHGLFEADSGVNEVLRDAGLTPDQAQVVYDLAARVLQPIVDEHGGERQALADDARLQQQFGGAEKWAETQRQLRVWGRRHLPSDAYESLSSSYDGGLALHRLMRHEEPSVLRGGVVGEAADEGALRRMIRDPRYWRDRDPAFVRKVSEGFKRLYPDE